MSPLCSVVNGDTKDSAHRVTKKSRLRLRLNSDRCERMLRTSSGPTTILPNPRPLFSYFTIKYIFIYIIKYVLNLLNNFLYIINGVHGNVQLCVRKQHPSSSFHKELRRLVDNDNEYIF